MRNTVKLIFSKLLRSFSCSWSHQFWSGCSWD